MNHEQEIKTFADFYRHRQQHAESFSCPICSRQTVSRFILTFNMNEYGKAEFSCPLPSCEFNKMAFTVEAVSTNNWKRSK